MDKYRLPTSTIIGDKECEFNTDYRDIIELFNIFNDPDLLAHEKIIVGLEYFYKTDDYKNDIEQAINDMMDFVSGCASEDNNSHSDKPLFDWDQDYSIIVAPINKVIGKDIRGLEYLHWWTFLSAFMEIGECTFNTYVGIRNKLNKNKKLDKVEERIFKEHKNQIILKRKYDTTTQELLDEIMGKGV